MLVRSALLHPTWGVVHAPVTPAKCRPTKTRRCANRKRIDKKQPSGNGIKSPRVSYHSLPVIVLVIINRFVNSPKNKINSHFFIMHSNKQYSSTVHKQNKKVKCAQNNALCVPIHWGDLLADRHLFISLLEEVGVAVGGASLRAAVEPTHKHRDSLSWAPHSNASRATEPLLVCEQLLAPATFRGPATTQSEKQSLWNAGGTVLACLPGKSKRTTPPFCCSGQQRDCTPASALLS